MCERIGVPDQEWALTGPLLPPEHGRGCRPVGENRRYFDGMMWMARSGAQRRLLPHEYEKWNSVFRRYRRYRRWVEIGVFDALLETLTEMVARDTSADLIGGLEGSLAGVLSLTQGRSFSVDSQSGR